MWAHAPIRMSCTIPLSIIAVVVQIMSSGLLVAYLASRIGDGGARIRLPGGSLNASSFLTTDTQWISLIAVASVVSVSLAYGERRFELELGRSYSMWSTKRALAEIGEERSSLGFDPGTLVRGAGAVAGTIGPIARGLLLTIVLIWLRWDLALALIAANVLIGVPLQSRLRKRIVSIDAQRRGVSSDFKQATKAATTHLAEAEDEAARATVIKQYAESSLLKDRVRLGLEVREAQQRAGLFSGLLTTAGTVCLAMVIAAAPDTEDGNASVLALVLFAIVLGLFYSSLRNFLGQLSTFHKHEHGLLAAIHGGVGALVGPGSVAYTNTEAPVTEDELASWLAALGIDPKLKPVVATAEEVQEISRAIDLRTSETAEPADEATIGRVSEILNRTANASGGVELAVRQTGEAAVPEGWVIAGARQTPGIVVVPAFVFQHQRPGQIRALLRLVNHHLVVVTQPDRSLIEQLTDAKGTPPIDLDADVAVGNEDDDE